ncbi:hypothetical protein MHYP_G00265750 [Metynnis hypsauchen]
MDPEPEPEPGTSSSFLPPTKDSKFLRFFQKTAEELIGWLACTLHPRYPVSFLHENLVDRLIEQVTEASKDSEVEIIEDLKVPACGNDTTDSTTTGTKKWKKLRARISSFVRRVFCCGCRSSRRLVPL